MPPGVPAAIPETGAPSAQKARRAGGPIPTAGARVIEVAAPKRAADVPASRMRVIGEGRLFRDAGLEDVDVASLAWSPAEASTRRTAVLVLKSAGAVGMRVGLRFSGPAPALRIAVSGSGAPDKVIDVDARAIAGASKTGVLWTPVTQGESQALELTSESGPVPAGRISIFGVSHLTAPLSELPRGPQKDLGASLSCQVDVVCVDSLQGLDASIKSAFDAKVASTALIGITTDSGATGTCTGTLLNNDYHAPVFLTAYHCIGTASEASNILTLWNFQATNCPATQYYSGDLVQGGSVWLSGSQELDETLVVLRDLPPSGAILSGWDAGQAYPTGTLMLGMHHPHGDLKKTSLGTIVGLQPPFTVDGVSHGANEFYDTRWQIGLVEPGSSGSGLFVQPANQTFLALIGTLNAGPASGLQCSAATTYVNTFSRLDLFFPSIKRFLASNYSADYTDLWWNPSENGWGINIQHQGDTLFATWFTYESSGAGMWLVMPGLTKQGDGTYQGAIYRTTGTPFNLINGAAAIDTPLNQVGSATITFPSANAGLFAYVVNGVSGLKSIQRQQFSTPATCGFTLGSRASATNYQDLWFNPSEPGWGINIAHQGNIVFATWFTYDSNRAGMWLVMSNGSLVGTNTFQGALYRTSGVPFNQINGAPAISGAPTQVGTLTLQFTDGQNAVMSYTVNGVSGSKAITREVFAYPMSSCH